MSQVLTDGNDTNVIVTQSTVYALDGNDIIRTSQTWTMDGIYFYGPDLYGGLGNDFLGYEGDGHIAAFGGWGSDAIHGGTIADILYGESGDDLLAGGQLSLPSLLLGVVTPYMDRPSGDDYLDGGQGGDALYGFDGNDTLIGGDGDDYDYHHTDATKNLVPTGDGFLVNVPGGLYGGAGNDFLDGGRGNDFLDGGAGNDTILGGEGNDILQGSGGADLLKGGGGDDTYLVDDALAVIVEGADEGFDTVLASVSYKLAANAAIEILSVAPDTSHTGLNLTGSNSANTITGDVGSNTLQGLKGSDTLSGLFGNDVLKGGLDNDRLFGGDGNDVLYGEAGNDILTGGAGRDSFVFNTKPDTSTNVDKIVDFRSVDDVFLIDRAIFKTIGPKGALKADAFHLGAKAADAEDRIIYDKKTGNLFYDSDGTGASAQIKIAILSNKAKIVLGDFIVI